MSIKLGYTRSIFCCALIAILAIIIATHFLSQKAPTAERIKYAQSLAREHILQSLTAGGFFRYDLDPLFDRSSDSDYDVRQMLASRELALGARSDEAMYAAHKKNLDAIFSNWYDSDGERGYLHTPIGSSLGVNALFLRVLVESPFFEALRREADMVVENILSAQHEDGSFDAYGIESPYAYNTKRTLAYAAPEALLALLEYVEKTGNDAVFTKTKKSFDFYYQKYVSDIEQNYYSMYVPWLTMAIYQYTKMTAETQYVEGVFVLYDRLLEMQDTLFFPGRFYDRAHPEYGRQHTGADAIFTEGLGYALLLAKQGNDTKRVDRYSDALKNGLSNLLSLQYTKQSPLLSAHREQYVGAFRIRSSSFWTRIDVTAHALDAFDSALQALAK